MKGLLERLHDDILNYLTGSLTGQRVKGLTDQPANGLNHLRWTCNPPPTAG